MCMVEDSDGRTTVLGEAQRKARKEHRCSECARVIRLGETYLDERLTFDGTAKTVKTCAHCQVARDWLGAECGGWLYTAVEEDITEHAQSGVYGMDIARIAVGMRRKWTTTKGALMQLPKLPPSTHSHA